MNIYLQLFLTFAKVGVCTFGGGYAMLPILQREIVENRHWATDDDLADYFALGQCTPGIIAVNTATFIGAKLKGIPGGICATLGVVFPSLIIILSVAAGLSQFQDNIYVTHAFNGIRACVCVLIINAVIKLAKSSLVDKASVCIFILVFVLSALLGLSPALLVVVCGFAGYVIHRIKTAQKVPANGEASNISETPLQTESASYNNADDKLNADESPEHKENAS